MFSARSRLTSHLLLLVMLLSTGCIDPVMLKSKPKEGDETAEGAAAVEQANPAMPTAGPQGFSKNEWRLVDRQKAVANNPALVETQNRINAMDPLLSATQAYFTLGSRAQLAAFKHELDLQKEMNNRYPTFDEFNKTLKDMRIEFAGLYPWQVYAYDEKNGEICILEDRALRNRLHEEKGLPIPQD